MNDFTREALPILFMYGVAFLLAPFIGYALWIAFEGDKMNAPTTETLDTPVAENAPRATPAPLAPVVALREVDPVQAPLAEPVAG